MKYLGYNCFWYLKFNHILQIEPCFIVFKPKQKLNQYGCVDDRIDRGGVARSKVKILDITRRCTNSQAHV